MVDLADEEASSNWQEDLTKDSGINKDKDGIFGQLTAKNAYL